MSARASLGGIDQRLVRQLYRIGKKYGMTRPAAWQGRGGGAGILERPAPPLSPSSRRQSNNSTSRGRQRVNSAPRLNKKARTKMIVVYGYGCDRFYNRVVQHQRNLRNTSKNSPNIDDVETLCNRQEPHSMTYDIWKTLVSKNPKLEPTSFVLEVLHKVCEAFESHDKVILIGHSYGGSVVSRVAMLAAKAVHHPFFPQKCMNFAPEKLRVVTFGSIFVPPPEMTHGIHVQHYTFRNDIAHLCHKQFGNCNYLTRMHQGPYQGPVGAHMNYNALIQRIARTGSTNVRAKNLVHNVSYA